MARTTTTNNNNSDLEAKLEEAKSENKIMMDMIKQLQEQIASMNNNSASGVVIKQNEDLTRLVKVTSLLNNVFNLTTEPYGKGREYTFRKFGETKNIKYTELQDIISIYKKDFETGRAVLGTKKDYEDLQIGYIYDDVLKKKDIQDIILLKTDEAVDKIIEMEDIDFQDNIASLIAQRIIDGQSCDYNRIKRLEDNGIMVNKFVDELREDLDK